MLNTLWIYFNIHCSCFRRLETRAQASGQEDTHHIPCSYYVGHTGKFGHEFLEFEFRPDGEPNHDRCRCASHQFRQDALRKQLTVQERHHHPQGGESLYVSILALLALNVSIGVRWPGCSCRASPYRRGLRGLLSVVLYLVPRINVHCRSPRRMTISGLSPIASVARYDARCHGYPLKEACLSWHTMAYITLDR